MIKSPRTLSGGTDGGLLNALGTFGFVWGDYTSGDEPLPIGKGHVPGDSLIMSSTRTELCGVFAALTHLRLVVEYYRIAPHQTSSCRIYCDSKAALARVVDEYYEAFGTTWLAEQTTILKLRSVPAFYSYQFPFRGNGYTAMRAVEKRNLSSFLPKYSTNLLTRLQH